MIITKKKKLMPTKYQGLSEQKKNREMKWTVPAALLKKTKIKEDSFKGRIMKDAEELDMPQGYVVSYGGYQQGVIRDNGTATISPTYYGRVDKAVAKEIEKF
jgi:hypothetical protein